MAKLARSITLHLRQDRLVEQGNFGQIALFGWRFSRVAVVLLMLLPFFSNRVGGLLSVRLRENKKSWRRNGGGVAVVAVVAVVLRSSLTSQEDVYR